MAPLMIAFAALWSVMGFAVTLGAVSAFDHKFLSTRCGGNAKCVPF